jgi:hypothetical protein
MTQMVDSIGVDLRAGTIGSVLVMTGTAGGGDRPVPPVPRALPWHPGKRKVAVHAPDGT